MKKEAKSVKKVVKDVKKASKKAEKAPKSVKTVKTDKVSVKSEKAEKKAKKDAKNASIEETKVIEIPVGTNTGKLDVTIGKDLDIIDTRIGQVEDNLDILGQESTRLALDLKTETKAREVGYTLEQNARIAEDGLINEKVEKLNKMLTGALITWGVALILIIIFAVLILQFINVL